MLPKRQNVTKVYYLLYLHYVGRVPKTSKKSSFWHPKIDILGVSVHILASWSATMPIPSCQEANMPAFLVSWCQDTWLPGTWYLAVWSNTVRARGHLDNMVPFPPISPSGGEPQKSSKIVISWLHAATQPKCHETILFATFAPCWHGTKNIKKSTFWHPKKR